MMPWRLAWRAKEAAIRATVVPFGLMFALYMIESPLTDFTGTTIATALITHVMLEALYTVLDALLIGAVLNMLLSGRPLADSLPPVVPDRRAVHFALAFLPIGIATSLLHIVLLRYGVPALLAPLPADETQWPAGLLAVVRPVLALLGAPTLQWLVAGLALAPLALRLLHLPAVAGTPPSARPTLGLAGMLLAAIVLGNLIEYAPTTLLPVAGDAVASVIAHAVILLGWYAGTFVMTLLIASSVAALLWRRSRRVDPPSP